MPRRAFVAAVVATLLAGCMSQPEVQAPGATAAATEAARPAQSVAVAGTTWYNQTVEAQACPAQRGVFAETFGPSINVTGAVALDLVLEWQPVDPVMKSAQFSLKTIAGKDGASVNPPVDEVWGPSPLVWHLGADRLSTHQSFGPSTVVMLEGPACPEGAPSPGVAPAMHQAATFHGNVTRHA